MLGEEGRDTGTEDSAVTRPLVEDADAGQGAQSLSERGAAHTQLGCEHVLIGHLVALFEFAALYHPFDLVDHGIGQFLLID